MQIAQILYYTPFPECFKIDLRIRHQSSQKNVGQVAVEKHHSSHSQVKRHCPSVKQRAVGKERCLLDRPSRNAEKSCARVAKRLP